MRKDLKINVGQSALVLPLLTILFVGLKLTGFIAWSWLWVLSPLWIPFAGALFFLFLAVFLMVLL